MPDRQIITELENYYPLKITRAYNNNPTVAKHITDVIKGLKDIYRYFEPEYFGGQFHVCKNFNDAFCFPRDRGMAVYDKNVLLNRTAGNFIIQVFNDDSIFMWESEDATSLLTDPNSLTYSFKENREYFLANGQTIEVTIQPKGSRYAPQYIDLLNLLSSFNIERIYQSSCPLFKQSWFDQNRLFFRSEGSGKNVPEKFMQEALYEYLRIALRGISIETSREYNVNPDQPKPVDLKIQWKEANRTALVEVKWIGAVKSAVTGKTRYNDSEKAANPGYVQLKGYYDSALSDTPNTIIKAHLVVIDGRRNNLTEDATTINYADGMFFKDKDIVIEDVNQYYKSLSAFEKPFRMFASPICI